MIPPPSDKTAPRRRPSVRYHFLDVLSETSPEIEVRDNRRELRYEALAGDELLGQIRYRLEPGLVVLVHTDVATSAEGKGVGSRLVEGALADIRERGLRVVPICPFVADYIRRHPEDADLVETDPATPD
jgi:predicted GNAT family acetyltransferase